MESTKQLSCNTIRRSLLIAGSLAVSGIARASTYPDRPIHILVPGAPGTAFDIVVRMIGEALGRKYNQAVVIDNRAGASGLVGMRDFASNKPDGYTLMAGGLGPSVMLPAMFTHLPVDPRQFLGVAELAESANILVTRPDLPFKTVADLIAAAKARPGQLSMGTNDIGSSMHMSYELLAQKTDTKFIHVPYKGPNEVMSGLMSNTIDAGITSFGPCVPMIKAGRLRALAVTTVYRQDLLSDVLTMQEAGIKDYDVGSWLCLHALKGTPSMVIEKVGDDVVEIVGRPAIGEKLKDAGYVPQGLNAKAFQAKWEKDLVFWTAVAKKANLVKDYRTKT